MYENDLKRLRELDPGNALLWYFESSGDTYFSRLKLARELERFSASDEEEAPRASTAVAGSRQRPERASLPEVLWPAYDRQSELYKTVNHLHPQLDLLYINDVGRCYSAAKKLVATWREIDAIYRLLDYWKETGTILPNKYSEAPASVVLETDLRDLMRRQEACKRFITRNKNKPDRAEEIRERQSELKLIKAMIQNA